MDQIPVSEFLAVEVKKGEVKKLCAVIIRLASW